jgi:hypothetical protein
MWPTLKEIDFAKYVRGELEIHEENLPEILPDGSVRKLQ